MEKENIKYVIEDKWDAVYLKDKPFMPFGSMVNAYGLINQGTGESLDKFLSDMDTIWARSLKMVAELSNKLKSERKKATSEVDLPTENR